MADNKKDPWTSQQSDLLKRVNLKVTDSKFKHFKLFGTEIKFKDGEYQDPCSGDSGGPLMYRTNKGRTGRWVIIGWFNNNILIMHLIAPTGALYVIEVQIS